MKFQRSLLLLALTATAFISRDAPGEFKQEKRGLEAVQRYPVEPFEWRTASPESQGMSSAKLAALKDDLARRNTRAFLVIRNDNIVYEWYADDQSPRKLQGTASLAKAIVGGLSLAVAMTDGKIALDDPASRYAPEWRNDPRKAKITIRHLGSHTSGLEDAEADRLPHEQGTGWIRPTIPLPSRAIRRLFFSIPARSFSTAIPASPC